jgi:radical SAM protein with 4Fe4S-binding SPASM domain
MDPPLLLDCLEWAKGLGNDNYCFLTTNGSLCDSMLSGELMQRGLDSLKFSINAADAIQFEEVMGVKPKLFEKALNNLKAAREIRDEMGYKTRIYASSILFDGVINEKNDVQPMQKGERQAPAEDLQGMPRCEYEGDSPEAFGAKAGAKEAGKCEGVRTCLSTPGEASPQTLRDMRDGGDREAPSELRSTARGSVVVPPMPPVDTRGTIAPNQFNRMQKLLVERVLPYVDEHYWLPCFSEMAHPSQEKNRELGFKPWAGNQGRLDNLREPLPCWSVFMEGHVRVDGHLSACCFGATDTFDMGDLTQQSFMEAWNSKKFQELRRAHLAHDVHGTACESCIYG